MEKPKGISERSGGGDDGEESKLAAEIGISDDGIVSWARAAATGSEVWEQQRCGGLIGWVCWAEGAAVSGSSASTRRGSGESGGDGWTVMGWRRRKERRRRDRETREDGVVVWSWSGHESSILGGGEEGDHGGLGAGVVDRARALRTAALSLRLKASELLGSGREDHAMAGLGSVKQLSDWEFLCLLVMAVLPEICDDGDSEQ
ncbi:hypothetical protein M0R45_019486 [Rubus argutus]|uniref:Uncharacterized protein n=1 Tax=Rubus argutus TaxID=59490 RepID=A0AAW1X601_RUBAR